MHFRFDKATEMYNDMIAKEPSNSVSEKEKSSLVLGDVAKRIKWSYGTMFFS